MLIKGVSDGGAAAKAGLKEGDKIVEIAGRPVTSVQSYMAVMAQLRRGEAVEVRVERDGKKQTFKVTPQ
jgi:S1-C subfamily serine protease